MESTAGSPSYIKTDMVLSSIQKLKLWKSPGPPGIVAAMLKAPPEKFSQLIADLI